MRARLSTMELGGQFTCICLPVMLDAVEVATGQYGGEIVMHDTRNYGVVLTILKNREVSNFAFPLNA